MKRSLVLQTVFLICFGLFFVFEVSAQTSSKSNNSVDAKTVSAARELLAGELDDEDEEEYVYPKKDKIYPSPKRPRKPDAEAVKKSAEKNEEHATENYMEKTRETFLYGRTDEISEILDSLTVDEDVRFADELYDLFQETKSVVLKQKILTYFTKLKDPCLEDYAVEVINDPYDSKKTTVNLCFTYVSEVKCRDAVPGVMEILDKEDEDYFNGALSCLGDIGGSDEALYVAQYLKRDDLSTMQRQSLMKVLGKIKAVETYDALVEIAENEDENTYVRSYAAEAIGSMEVGSAEDILIDLYEAEEPVLREYVVKGLSHFNDDRTNKVLVQALRDDNYRVRLAAIDAVAEHNYTAADSALIYHCKNKEETVVKQKIYKVLAKMNTSKGNEYLVSVIKDKKAGDTVRANVAAALLEYNNAGSEEIIALAKETVADDKLKSLRYALGKEFAKYGRTEYNQICGAYLSSKDVSTQGIGLDIFAKGKYSDLKSSVESLARLVPEETDEKDAKKTAFKKANNVNAVKAKRIYENLYGKLSPAKTSDEGATISNAQVEK